MRDRTIEDRSSQTAIDTSLVIVARNAERVLEPLLARIAHALVRTEAAEVIVVDDASTDGTLACLQRHEAQLPRLSIVRHEHARGVGDAVRTGVGQARGAYVFVGEAGSDLPVLMLKELRDALIRGADVALATRPPGRRQRALDSGIERLTETAFTTLARLLVAMPARDVQAVFRGFRRRAVQKLAMRSRVRNGSYAIEWLGLAEKLKLSVVEMPCPATAPIDAAGHSERSLRDLWKIRKDLASNRYRQVRKDFGSLADTSIVRRDQLGI